MDLRFLILSLLIGSPFPLFSHTPPPPTGFAVQSDPYKACVLDHLQMPETTARVAFVLPTFTLTPYYDFSGSFYAFYLKYASAKGNITTDLGWLSTPVTNALGYPSVSNEYPLYAFVNSDTMRRCGLTLGSNLKIVDDIAVDSGALFQGGAKKYDVVVLGHEEYVTAREYGQFKSFVASGGRIVEMSGNTFWAQVTYSPSTTLETFVAGHGFRYNGMTAWKTDYEPFDSSSSGWFGSTFATNVSPVYGATINASGRFAGALRSVFHSSTVFGDYDYPHNEVNYVRNFTDTEIIARYYIGFSYPSGAPVYAQQPVYSYIHNYTAGQVVCLCVFGENIIQRDIEAQYFMIRGIEFGFPFLRAGPGSHQGFFEMDSGSIATLQAEPFISQVSGAL